MTHPTIQGVREARSRIAPYLSQTPLRSYPSVSALVGAEVWVKHENMLPTGAFKVRGGVNLLAAEHEGLRDRGVIGASTGNHGQSVAYAAKLFGVPAKIFVPEGANATKVRAMQDMGAEVLVQGADFDEARAHAAELADQYGYRYIHSGDEHLLIEGVGTHTLEILEEVEDLDAIFVPIGGGSGAAGACLVAKALRPRVKVIGVQSSAAPTAHDSWRKRELLTGEIATRAEGLATGAAFELPQQIMWEFLDDFVLVSDEELERATLTLIAHTRTLVELAGGAAFAAALSMREQLVGKRVAVICSGANITPDQLRSLLVTR